MNIRTQGRSRLICKKRHDLQLVIKKLRVLKEYKGAYETKFVDQVFFTDDGPVLQLGIGRDIELKNSVDTFTVLQSRHNCNRKSTVQRRKLTTGRDYLGGLRITIKVLANIWKRN